MLISRRAWVGALCGVLAVVPLFFQPQYVHLLTMIFFFSVSAMSLRFLLNTGRLSLGQAFFASIGGYASALLSLKLGINPWLGLLAGWVSAGVVAILVGLVILRVPGIYFAVITLALLEIWMQLINTFKEITGGVHGIVGVPGYAIGGFNFGVDRAPYYYLMLAIAAVAVFVLYRMEHSPLGLLMHSMGQNDEVIEHFGVNVTRYRILAMSVGAVFTGMAGSFYAHYMHVLSSDAFGLWMGIQMQIYVIVGGVGSFIGPIVGAVAIEGLSNSLRLARAVQPILYGGVLLAAFMLLDRRGLTGALESLGRWMLSAEKRSTLSNLVRRCVEYATLHSKLREKRVSPSHDGLDI